MFSEWLGEGVRPSVRARVAVAGNPQIAGVLYPRQRAWQPLPQSTDKLAEVVEAGTAIARGLDLDDTLQTIVEAAARVTRAAYCALGVLGPDRRISRFITTG